MKIRKYAPALLALVVLAIALMLLFPGVPERYIRIIFGWTESPRFESPIGPREPAVEAQVRRIMESGGLGAERATPLPAGIFSQLPKFPPDFYRVEILNTYDHLTDAELVSLPEEYWKQPEWYPGFSPAGVEIMKGAEGGIGAVYGYGAYKADIWRTAKRGENFTAVVFIHASWGVRSYQGFMMATDYNRSAFEEVSASPGIFLLTPTWPGFTQNWTQKVVVTGRVSENAEPGDYLVTMMANRPPEELAAQWGEAYTYADPTFRMGFGRPIFQLHLNVQG
ncbi:MAG: hypothetical protein WC759_01220 [Candidatus Micrarchaeia archaeon]